MPNDLERRGIDSIPGHPYVEDATLAWPALVGVVTRHLDDLDLDDEQIHDDRDLQSWYLALAKSLPNVDVDKPLTRKRLTDLLAALIYNNVIHEICGDLSPILGSTDPDDKIVVNLAGTAVCDRTTTGWTQTFQPPTMADVFLIDQASFVSRFNVGGNNLLDINAARFVNDPKLRIAIEDMQATLRDTEAELHRRNGTRDVRFARMLPSAWEASISF